ncbi:MAG: hypothetical protein SGPRY_013596, partial [Prymnesium sp.]
ADVVIHIFKGPHNFGINVARQESGVIVMGLDKGSEAEKAGVQPGDRLLMVQDLDRLIPPDNPGGEIPVSSTNFHEALGYVRQMKHCRFFIQSQTAAVF